MIAVLELGVRVDSFTAGVAAVLGVVLVTVGLAGGLALVRRIFAV